MAEAGILRKKDQFDDSWPQTMSVFGFESPKLSNTKMVLQTDHRGLL